jgi:hypothetical protein
MRMRILSVCIAATAASFSATAQTPADVEDLVGARAAGGETQLLSRGYEQRASNTVRDQRFTFWWKPQSGHCISVSTVDGRYASIQPVPRENCTEGSTSSRTSSADDRDPNSLVLVCYGAGSRPTVESDPSYSWDHDRHKWHETDTIRSGTKGFSSDVQIELYGDHGRIHLGSDLIPPIHSGGSNDWWELENLVTTSDRISASYRLNGMNKPKLSIDRRSGQISIDAMTDFNGHCDIGNWGGGARRF